MNNVDRKKQNAAAMCTPNDWVQYSNYSSKVNAEAIPRDMLRTGDIVTFEHTLSASRSIIKATVRRVTDTTVIVNTPMSEPYVIERGAVITAERRPYREL